MEEIFYANAANASLGSRSIVKSGLGSTSRFHNAIH
jgi:hypothetical protein